MEMKRIEAETLEEAYSQAAKALSCSVTEINYEIVQHPTSGVMGMFKKPAIIIAVKKIVATTETTSVAEEAKVEVKKDERKPKSLLNDKIKVTPKKASAKKAVDKEVAVENVESKKVIPQKEIEVKEEAIVDDFFKEEVVKSTPKSSEAKVTDRDNETVSFDDDRDSPENRERSIEIEKKLQGLMKAGCFEIDTVEVDVFNGIAHIFIDGDDAALLIGKEGYRYNALSYMLFNWINAEYNLYIKLEIAEFIQAQEEMIDSYLKPIAEHIQAHGKGKTKPLDGILVQIALEKLRAMFPNKYVAIKTAKDAKKFIIINDFNTRKN